MAELNNIRPFTDPFSLEGEEAIERKMDVGQKQLQGTTLENAGGDAFSRALLLKSLQKV